MTTNNNNKNNDNSNNVIQWLQLGRVKWLLTFYIEYNALGWTSDGRLLM